MGLTEFKLSNQPIIAAVLIISGSLLAVHILFGGAPYAKSKLKNWSWRKATREYLSDLTDQEKEFLRSYINDGQNTRYASIHDGVANGLVAKGIVYRASNFSVGGVPGNKFAFNLQHYARRYLKKESRVARLTGLVSNNWIPEYRCLINLMLHAPAEVAGNTKIVILARNYRRKNQYISAI